MCNSVLQLDAVVLVNLLLVLLKLFQAHVQSTLTFPSQQLLQLVSFHHRIEQQFKMVFA